MSGAIEHLQRSVDHWRGRFEAEKRRARAETEAHERRIRELESVVASLERRLGAAHRETIAWRQERRAESS